MRILLASPGMAIGGAERVVLQLAAGLTERGHRVAVSGAAGPLDGELSRLDVERIVLPERGRSATGAVGAALRLAAAIRRQRPDVVHGHNVKASVTAAAAARVALGPWRPALVTTFHGVAGDDRRRSARLLRAVDAVACVSGDLADQLAAAGLPRARLSVVNNAVATPPALGSERRAALDDELGLAGRPVVLAVGRLVEQKNHARLLEAAADLRRRGVEARFLIAGEGPLRATLETRRDALGLGADVTFLGPRPDARELMARADLVVFSSDWEGLSIAALEALAAGTPIVTTPVEGMRLLLGDAGVVAPDFSAGALGDCIAALLADGDGRAAMGEAGRELVAQRFSLGAMLDAYERLYAAMREGS
jgi:glycosyltransferase involved in cell wall biosynthesis